MSSESHTNSSSPISLKLSDPEVVDGVWPSQSDLLNRAPEIENLSPVLLNADAPLVFGVDAPWGGGKTTFIRLWRQYLTSQGFVSLYLNAWESDFSDDPFLPMISTLDEWLDQQSDTSKAKKAWDKAKFYAPGIVKSAAVAAVKAATLGALDIDKEYEKLASELMESAASGLIDSFKVKQASLARFKGQLSLAMDALPEVQRNLIIFVDEIDRCKPTYAIELLERIKHLFDIDRIVFVLAMNRDQLSKSLQGMYGPAFDGSHYLKRFIDMDYKLVVPDLAKYISAQLRQPDIRERADSHRTINTEISWVQETFFWLCDRFNYQLRDVNQLITRFRLILRSIPKNESINPQVLSAMLFLRENKRDLYYAIQVDSRKVNDAILFLLGRPVEDGVFSDPFPVVSGVMLGALTDEKYRGEVFQYWCDVRDQFEPGDDSYRQIERLRSIAAEENCWSADRLVKLMHRRIELVENIAL